VTVKRRRTAVARAVGLVLAAVLFSGAAPVNIPEESPACSIAWGTFVSGDPAGGMAETSGVDGTLGRHSQIVHMYTQWGTSWGSFDSNQPLFDRIHNYSSAGVTGATPLLTWEPWGPNFSLTPAEFPLTSIAGGRYDDYIDSWAKGLRGLGYPVLLDFAHEMNGNWYPWAYGVNDNTPHQYIAAYRHVHQRFIRAGATNVRFVWNPDNWSPSGISVAAFYPGHRYVDWMAIDAYNWDTSWDMPYTQLQTVYSQMTALNGRKPVMLAEVASQSLAPAGATPVDKAAWITALFQTLPMSFPQIRAVVWFNAANTEFDITSPPAVLAAAQTALQPC